MAESAEHAVRGEVVAVVLTYNAPAALERCVAAIATQTRPPNRVLVVDNASERPAADLADRFPTATVHRTPENLGPAGGYAVGLRLFREATQAGSWAWVLDDDCVPEPSALEQLLVTATADASPALVFATVTDTQLDDPVVGVGWWGVLIPWSAVDRFGVPMAELFWWAEDTEYLQWRLPRAGFKPRIARTAVVRVDRARASRAKPAWKYYYETRNTVYYRLHVQRRTTPMSVATARNLGLRIWKTCRSIGKLSWRVLSVESEDRVTKLVMVARGVLDGLGGRLGRPVPVSSADRPLIAPE